jgi:hypothetical protein
VNIPKSGTPFAAVFFCVLVFCAGYGGCADEARPVYPLYAIVSGDVEPTQADIEVLARNFDLGQMSFASETIRAIHKIDPEFKAVRYFNSTYTSSAEHVPLVEKQHRKALAMFVVATLKDGIDETTTVFALEPPKKGAVISLRASTSKGPLSASGPEPTSTKEYVTWIRMDDEFMRIDAFDRSTGQIAVTRGYDGTQTRPHKSGANVFSPVYLGSVNDTGAWPGGPGKYLRYAFDPANPAGTEWRSGEMAETIDRGYDGFWLDICSASPFNMSDSDGRHVTPWDFRTGMPYDKDAYCLGQQIKVNAIQNSVKTRLGTWPTMIANNMKAQTFEPGSGGQRLMLVPTDVKQRPIDGYCIENYAGHFAARAANRTKDGAPEYHALETWRENQIMVMTCAQNGLAAYPMIANAGIKSLMLEGLGPVRDRFESFAYSSYLICIEKGSPTKLGLPAFYQEEGRRFAKVHPRYGWPIGDPAETVAPEDVDKYRVEGHSTYRRRFDNGIVFVNPSEENDDAITLDQPYIDPSTGDKTSTVRMNAHTGKILLKEF